MTETQPILSNASRMRCFQGASPAATRKEVGNRVEKGEKSESEDEKRGEEKQRWEWMRD